MHERRFIGLDVHARSVQAGVLDGLTGEVRSFAVPVATKPLVAWVYAQPAPAVALDAAIAAAAARGPWAEVVARLGWLRGVSTLTACALTVEIGDWQRFCGRSLAAFLGLTPPRDPLEPRVARDRSPRPATRMCAACWSRPPGSSAGHRARACARDWRASEGQETPAPFMPREAPGWRRLGEDDRAAAVSAQGSDEAGPAAGGARRGSRRPWSGRRAERPTDQPAKSEVEQRDYRRRIPSWERRET